MPAQFDFLDQSRPDVPDLVVSGAVVPFHLSARGVRGRLIRLGRLAEALLSRHDNPDVVSRVAGGMLAMAAGLASALKFQGSFSIQAKGDGPISLLAVDCTDTGALRFYARADERLGQDSDTMGATASARSLLGNGYLAITVDQGEAMDRYQGIVAIEGETLADMAQHYFETSEQHDCRIWLACDRFEGEWRSSALVLERIPPEGGVDPETFREISDESWLTVTTLASTVTEEELLSDHVSSEDLLFRLFHAEGVSADRPRTLAYGCRCSRAKLAGILETFSSDDLDHMDADGDIVMTCEFCNVDFRFPRRSITGATAPGTSETSGRGAD